MKPKRELTSKRLRARHLLIVKGYSQKETAKIVECSEKTISTWVKLYKWKDEETKEVKKQGGLSVMMERFFTYIRSTSSEMVDPVKNLWIGFLKSEQKDIG